MSIGAGFSTKTAWRKEDTQADYGEVIECGADQQIPLISEDLSFNVEKDPDNVVRYKAGQGAAYVTRKGVAGPANLECVYRGLESIFASACGLCNYSESPKTMVAGVYKHTFELDENIGTKSWAAGDGILAGSGYLAGDNKVRRGTLCIDKSVSIWEFASAMINSITIHGDSKGVRVDLDLVPYNIDRASAVNTASTTWSIPDDDWESVLFQDMAIWIDDYSEVTALTSADAVGVSEFSITLNNNLKIYQDSVSGLHIAEPRREGKRQVTGSFTFPRYESDDFIDKLTGDDPMMAMIRFVGSEIASTGYYRTLWIWLPNLKFDKVDAPVSNSGLLSVTHEFTAFLPDAAPAGFPTQATKEMLIQLQNDYDTNPLI